MKFCCGVTLYYPSKNELESIRKYREIFDFVYLFDNTDSSGRLNNEKFFFDDDGFVYCSNKTNEGLSVAYNIMCSQAISDGFDYICLFDQDSTILNKDVIKIIDYIHIDDMEEVAVYAPEIVYKYENIAIYSGENKARGVEIAWAISSGSFINLVAYQKTEGFDENYFIDRLDYDYCLIIRRLGYKVINIKNVLLYQKLGEQGKGIFKRVSQHGALRHYYIFRNRLYFYFKRNKISIVEVIKVGLLSLKHIVKVFLLEEQKVEKVKMMICGLKDFSQNKMGKYQKL